MLSKVMAGKTKQQVVRNFIRYVDSCGDYFYLSYKTANPVRKEFARLLLVIKQNKFHWQLDFMEFYNKNYGCRWSHDWHYHREFYEILKEII